MKCTPPSRRAAGAIAVLAVLALAVAVSYAVFSGGHGAREDAAASDLVSRDWVPRRATPSPTVPQTLQPGFGGTYRLSGSLDMTAEVASGRVHRTGTLSGRLVLASARSDPRGGWVAGRFEGLMVGGDQALRQQLGLDAADPGALEAPFGLLVDGSGAVVERRFDARMPPAERNLVATIAGGLQVVAPSGANGRTWRASEPGATDTQYAEYERIGDGDLRKKWSRKRAAGDASTTGDAGAEPRANGFANLVFEGGLLVAMQYRHELWVDMTLHESVPQRYAVKTSFELAREGEPPAQWVQSVDVASLPTEDQIEATKQATPAVQQPGGRSVSDIVAAAGKAQGALDWSARGSARDELGANLAAHPDQLLAVRKDLWQPGLAGDGLRTRLEALSVAGTPDALAVVRDLIADKSAPYLARHGAATLATTMAKPDAALVAALTGVAENDADEINAAAVFALAGIARLRADDKPELAKSVGSYVSQKAAATFAADRHPVGTNRPESNKGAKPASNVGVWLQAIGTVGGVGAWPLVEPYLVDRRDQFRLYAIEGLRFIPLSVARVALAKALQKDPRPENRRRAAEIALFQPQQAMEEPVLRALREDPAPGVKIGAGHTLAVWGVTTPGLYASIADQAATTQNPEVAKILKGLLPVDLDAKAKEEHP